MAVDDCVEIRFDSLFDPWLRIAFLSRVGLVWLGYERAGLSFWLLFSFLGFSRWRGTARITGYGPLAFSILFCSMV